MKFDTTIYIDSRMSGPSATLNFCTPAQAREYLDELSGKWADAMRIELDSTYPPAPIIAGTLAKVRKTLAD